MFHFLENLNSLKRLILVGFEVPSKNINVVDNNDLICKVEIP
jgi:hypothetical protein